MLRKELGKITRATFGYGGYQDVEIGLHLTFQGEAWGVSKFDGFVALDRNDRCQWSEEDRLRNLGETVMRVKDLLSKAKVKTVDQLVNIPVEVIFDGNALQSFRVLEEVL